MALFPELGFLDAVLEGFERRADEVQIGLNGVRVYRQEFFAWDYLENHPLSSILGVGLGQYFRVLQQAYGTGVGINEYGGLIPINSTFLEILFDLSG